jgi:hypothetical protein
MHSSDQSPRADVYAGDLSSPKAGDTVSEPLCFFDISADAEPGTFARIANVLNIANTAPNSVILEVRQVGRLSIYIEIDGISLLIAESIARKLSQLTDVLRVNTGVVP